MNPGGGHYAGGGMRIVMTSFAFFPSIGGLETTGLQLAEDFVGRGHEVVVVTRSPPDGPERSFPFIVLRRPDPRRLFQVIRTADIVFQNNISLQLGWPALLLAKPMVVTHQVWLGDAGSRFDARVAIKRLILRRARCVAASEALARQVGVPAEVILNPIDHGTFRVTNTGDRPLDLVFAGRLIRGKGVQVLLEALALLHGRGHGLTLTIAGTGADEAEFRALADGLGLSDHVRFAGPLGPAALADLFNQHKIVVVPSLWEEPFGMVTTEGMACGCIAVVSDCGGLPEAVGPFGVRFRKGDPGALADGVVQALAMVGSHRMTDALRLHLMRQSRDHVTDRYLAVFADVLRGRAGPPRGRPMPS